MLGFHLDIMERISILFLWVRWMIRVCLERPVRLDAMQYRGLCDRINGHFSEYIPYYRKRQDLIDRHCSVGYNGLQASARMNGLWKARDRELEAIMLGKKELSLGRP